MAEFAERTHNPRLRAVEMRLRAPVRVAVLGRTGVGRGAVAAAPADQFRLFEERFGVTLLESYGQTENCVALANPIDERRVG
ncbi:hypothetical protein ASJ79_30160, partial [Mycobacterium sp. NAZ190054]